MLALVAAISSMVFGSGPVLAQGSDPPEKSAAEREVIAPPELIHDVQPALPPDANVASPGRVALLLTIDADGRVAQVEVAEATSAELVEPALLAARELVFRPARRGGVAVPARVRFAFDFAARRAASERDPAPARAPASGEARAAVPASARTSSEPRSTTGTASRTPTTASPRPPSERAAPPRASERVEVVVRGVSLAEQRESSAEAVQVIDTREVRRQAADLGEVLARHESVNVRRSGALGAETHVSLAGLGSSQVRLFLDGVPLWLAGFPFDVAHVPVNLVERVEIYRGVVPVRFGADALGGALNLVTPRQLEGTRASASYQAGSWDTHRFTAGVRHVDEDTGVTVGVNGFLDASDNDYPIDVEVSDARGRTRRARVHRFHDGYSARGLGIEVGQLGRPWARRLTLRAFVTEQREDVQHAIAMGAPYGQVHTARSSRGLNLRFEQPLGAGDTLELVLGAARLESALTDTSRCVYDWYGQCLVEREHGGEIRGRPLRTEVGQTAGFARLNVRYDLGDGHTVALSLAPTAVSRDGVDRYLTGRGLDDPLTLRRALLSSVAGAEHRVRFADDRLENIVFVKDYFALARAGRFLASGGVDTAHLTAHRAGVGEALRWQLHPHLLVKASYELATRLPQPDEIFGDGLFVDPNLELQPETSHNLNGDVVLSAAGRGWGRARLEAGLLLRWADRIILPVADTEAITYRNVHTARIAGGQVSAEWTSTGDRLTLAANASYLDARNTSSTGPYAQYHGDRLPNQPYWFGNAMARVRWRDVAVNGDEASVALYSRFVHEFYRSWARHGSSETKAVVPTQWINSVALTHVSHGPELTWSNTLEVQNLCDVRAFDYFGVQLPGRVVMAKTTLEY